MWISKYQAEENVKNKKMKKISENAAIKKFSETGVSAAMECGSWHGCFTKEILQKGLYYVSNPYEKLFYMEI